MIYSLPLQNHHFLLQIGMEQDINSNYYERQRVFSMTGTSSIFMEEDSSDYETTLTSGGSHGISYLPSIFSFKKMMLHRFSMSRVLLKERVS